MAKLLSTLLMIIGLSACTIAPLPEDHYYRLETDAPATPQTPGHSNASLTVTRIHMAGVYSERPLLYSTAQAPTELRQYHYHYWADSPERQIQEQLAAYLRAAHIVGRVNLGNSSPGTDDYQVSGNVRRFEQRLDGSSAHVLVELELAVSRKVDNTTVLSKTYRVDTAARNSSALASAQGLSQALTQCFAQFVDDLSAIDPL